MARDSAYMREIGRRGGQTTAKRYGREHMAKIGRRGAAAFYARYQLIPLETNQFGIVDRNTKKLIAVR